MPLRGSYIDSKNMSVEKPSFTHVHARGRVDGSAGFREAFRTVEGKSHRAVHNFFRHSAKKGCGAIAPQPSPSIAR